MKKILLIAAVMMFSFPVYAADKTLPTLTGGGAVSAGDLFITRQGSDTSDTSVTGTQLNQFFTPGNDSEIVFNSGGLFGSDTGLTFNSISDVLSVGGGYDCTGAVDCDFGSADITDMTFTTDGGVITFDGGISLTTGKTLVVGANTIITSDKVDGEHIADDTIDDDSIDFSDVTLADLTFDVGSVDTTEFGYLNGVTSAIQTQIDTKAVETQTFQWTGMIETPSDKTYHISIDTAYAGTITEVVTVADSGTGTWTCSINATPLGGTANSVSSTEQTQAHASDNTFAAGDEISCDITSNSSLDDMRWKIEYTRVLED